MTPSQNVKSYVPDTRHDEVVEKEGRYSKRISTTRKVRECAIKIFTLLDGSTYRGPMKNGLANGKGILTYPDGTVYVGEFFQGMKHGHGVETYDKECYIQYTGGFKYGRPYGVCRLIYLEK